MKKIASLLLVFVLILSCAIPVFAAEVSVPDNVSGYQLPGSSDIYVDVEDPEDIIGELDEEASCILTIELDASESSQTRDIHIPNIITVKLTPGKKGFAVFVINTGVDALSTLHLNLRLTDYNGNYIDSHVIDDISIPVGERSYTWLKDKSATIKEKMLIDLTQHTTRCSNRSDKSQEHLISSHAAVEAEAELIQI